MVKCGYTDCRLLPVSIIVIPFVAARITTSIRMTGWSLENGPGVELGGFPQGQWGGF